MEYSVNYLTEYVAESLTDYIKIIEGIDDVFNGKYVNDQDISAKIENPSNIIFNSKEEIESKLKNYHDFVIYNNIKKQKIRPIFFYRGQYDDSIKQLLPGIYRSENIGKEDVFYHQAQRLCSKDFVLKNHIDTLTTMQHYDFPTRLLDLTISPLTALYFACKNNANKQENKNGYVYVFAADSTEVLLEDSDRALILSCLPKFDQEFQKELYDDCIKKIKEDGINAVFDSKNNGKYVEALYHEIRRETSFEKRLYVRDIINVYFLMPNYSNSRINLQQGAFLISGLSKNSSDCDDMLQSLVLLKIKILNQSKILGELDKLNINDATLFSELDKIANFLKNKELNK